MANLYTYEQFQKAAQDAGLLDQFSDADLALAQSNPDAGMSILSYKRDYANATTDEARALANEGAESIRSSYGNYTGGADGGSFELNALSPSSFVAEEAPTYENRYDDQTQQLISGILNREEFSYDAASDPSYQAYAKQYAREGQRATQDALGAAAASSGGIASSYALTAASQAGDYYASKMADKIPELYQQAYERYLNEYDMLMGNLNMLQSAEQIDYSKYQDQMSQYNTDRSFNYNQLMDEVDSQSTDYERQYDEALLGANYGDYSGLKNLGIDPSNYELYQMALLGADYGDYSGLQAMGIDTSNNDTDYERKYNEALLAASYGDYSKLAEMGIDASNNDTDWEREYNIALLKAQYGDYSGLQALGINVAGSTASSGSSSSSKSGSSSSETSPTGSTAVSGSLSAGDKADLLALYPDGVIPAATWNSLVSTYGASALTAAGFSCGDTVMSNILSKASRYT